MSLFILHICGSYIVPIEIHDVPKYQNLDPDLIVAPITKMPIDIQSPDE
jgi:hypothetical protein